MIRFQKNVYETYLLTNSRRGYFEEEIENYSVENQVNLQYDFLSELNYL